MLKEDQNLIILFVDSCKILKFQKLFCDFLIFEYLGLDDLCAEDFVVDVLKKIDTNFCNLIFVFGVK